jgi:hypothetical protein
MRVTANTFPNSLPSAAQLAEPAPEQAAKPGRHQPARAIAEDDPVAMRRARLQAKANPPGNTSATSRLQELAAARFSSIKALKSASDRPQISTLRTANRKTN